MLESISTDCMLLSSTRRIEWRGISIRSTQKHMNSSYQNWFVSHNFAYRNFVLFQNQESQMWSQKLNPLSGSSDLPYIKTEKVNRHNEFLVISPEFYCAVICIFRMCCHELHLFMKTFDPSLLLKIAAIQRLGIKRFRSSYYVHFCSRSNFLVDFAQKRLLRRLLGDGFTQRSSWSRCSQC